MIKKVLIYFSCVVLGLYGLRYLHWKGLLSQEQGYYAKYRVAFTQKNEYNVLFLGSSRVAMHYNTMLFDSLTGCNSFNLSLSGATSRVSLAALKAYLLNSKAPEYIIYETDLHNVNTDGGIMEFNNYFPFLTNEVLREEFNRIDPRMKHFYYNAFYSWPYTGYKNISTGLLSWFNKKGETDEDFYKGFIINSRKERLVLLQPKPYNGGFSVQNKTYFEELIQFCKQKKIRLAVVTSPMFAGGKINLLNKDRIVAEVDQIVSRRGLQHFNLSSTPYCDQRELFIDHFHMNPKGARLFTLKLAELYSNNCQKNALKP